MVQSSSGRDGDVGDALHATFDSMLIDAALQQAWTVPPCEHFQDLVGTHRGQIDASEAA